MCDLCDELRDYGASPFEHLGRCVKCRGWRGLRLGAKVYDHVRLPSDDCGVVWRLVRPSDLLRSRSVEHFVALTLDSLTRYCALPELLNFFAFLNRPATMWEDRESACWLTVPRVPELLFCVMTETKLSLTRIGDLFTEGHTIEPDRSPVLLWWRDCKWYAVVNAQNMKNVLRALRGS